MFEEIDNNWRCRQSAFNVPNVNKVSQQNSNENFDQIHVINNNVNFDEAQLMDMMYNMTVTN